MEYRKVENLDQVLADHGLWQETNGEEGERANLSGANLRYANLSSANLSSADLRYASLRYANLSSADLRYASLRYANLRYADLSSANLRYANLRYADLRYADLRYASLSSADLRYASLSSADLRYANLSGANLSNVNLEKPLPLAADLLTHLQSHVISSNFDQENWCGTTCCLSGAAGQLVDNQTLGVVVIKIVLPEFDTNALYQKHPGIAIAELDRVEAIYR